MTAMLLLASTPGLAVARDTAALLTGCTNTDGTVTLVLTWTGFPANERTIDTDYIDPATGEIIVISFGEASRRPDVSGSIVLGQVPMTFQRWWPDGPVLRFRGSATGRLVAWLGNSTKTRTLLSNTVTDFSSPCA